MATIKAGTYRFNDVPTFFLSSADIPFTTPVLDVSGVTLYIQGTRIYNHDGSGAQIWYEGVLRSSYADYDNMSLDTEAYTLDEGWNRLSNTLNLNSEGYGQTITILEDAEVSAEFYEWFSANTTEVKSTVTLPAGTYRFNDELSAPSEEFLQELSFSFTPVFNGVEYPQTAGAIWIEPSTADGGTCHVTYGTDLSFSDGNRLIVCENSIWATKTYGEGIQTITLPTDQEVSAEFAEWFTANADPVADEPTEPDTTSAATITYNGSVIASLNGGQTATLKCEGMRMESDVVVEVKERETSEPVLQEKTVTSNGEVTPDEGYDGLSKVTVAVESGLAINGIIEQYKVNAGATVNAGDFVEFVNKFGSGVFSSGAITAPDGVSACKLDNNRVLVAYSDGGNSNYGTAVVLTLGSSGVAVGTAAIFRSAGTKYCSAVALSDDKVLVAYTDVGNSNYCAAVVLTVDGATITAGTQKTVSSAATNYCSAVALNEKKVFVCYRHSSSSPPGVAVVLTISGTTITAGTETTFHSASTNDIYAVGLTEDRVLVCYRDNNNSYYGTAVVLSVSGTTISVGAETVYNKGQTDFEWPVALASDKVLVAYRDMGNSYYGTAVVLSVSGTTISVGAETVICNSGSSYFSAVALSESRALVVYCADNNGRAVILTVNGTTITSGETTVFDTSVSFNALVALSETSALVAYNNGAGRYAELTIDGTAITVDNENGIFVEPATSRLHNVGIAATSGTGGETVDVYVVG